jgi:hypothetical protein
MPDDIRKTDTRPGPRDTGGDGAAYGSGYGAGGLGAGEDRARQARPDSWHAPGVTPGGERTGTSTDGPRIALGEESEPAPPGDEEA